MTDADVIAAVRGVLWDAMRGREMGGDRTLVGMVKQLVSQRDEALENRRGEYDLREHAEHQRDALLAAKGRPARALQCPDEGYCWQCEARCFIQWGRCSGCDSEDVAARPLRRIDLEPHA